MEWSNFIHGVFGTLMVPAVNHYIHSVAIFRFHTIESKIQKTSITKWKAREIEIESDWCQIRILLLLFEYPLHSSCNYHYRFVFFGSLIGFGAKKNVCFVTFFSGFCQCMYLYIHSCLPTISFSTRFFMASKTNAFSSKLRK